MFLVRKLSHSILMSNCRHIGSLQCNIRTHSLLNETTEPVLQFPPLRSIFFTARSFNQISTPSMNDIVPGSAEDCLSFHALCSSKTIEKIHRDFEVVLDFIDEKEEASILRHVEPHLSRMQYQQDHWDDAIQGYRETEISRWPSSCDDAIQRLKSHSFCSPDSNVLLYTHVLDLQEDGAIYPHVDSVRFCGNIIAGLSLGSQSVMRLVREENKEEKVDVLLPRRSLYIMRDTSRYSFTHEILSNSVNPVHRDRPVPKTRRISVVCRNEP